MTPKVHFADAATAVFIILLPQLWECSFNKTQSLNGQTFLCSENKLHILTSIASGDLTITGNYNVK
jgi:hypothetical protein